MPLQYSDDWILCFHKYRMKPQMRPNKRFLKNTLLGAARQRDAEKKHHTEMNKSRSRGVSEIFTSQKLRGKRKEREQGEKSHTRHESSKRHSSSENDRKMSSKKKKRRTNDST